MACAQSKPFDFDNFVASPESHGVCSSEPPPLTSADIEVARQQGFANGVAEANASIAQSEHEALAAIGSALDTNASALHKFMERERDSLHKATSAFLKEFAGRLAAERETEMAMDLIGRLVAASSDQAPATLTLNPESLARLKSRLIEEISAFGASSFVALAGDDSFKAGECQLSWRGGRAERQLQKTWEQLDQMFPSAKPVTRKPKPTRRIQKRKAETQP